MRRPHYPSMDAAAIVIVSPHNLIDFRGYMTRADEDVTNVRPADPIIHGAIITF